MFGLNRPEPAQKEILEKDVWAALRTVNDPDLHKSIVEIGMVKNLVIQDGRVQFDILLTTTACPMKAKIQQDATEAVQGVPGVQSVQANISAETLAPKISPKAQIPGIKNIIAVSSGKGGVGKTTVSVNLACALQKRGASVGILDADIYGPNVPLMMGLRTAVIKEKTEDGKLKPPENHGVKVMSMGFLVKDEQPVVWRGPLLDRVIRQFFNDTGWGELDYLIVDLPPGTGDAQLTIIEAVPLAGAVIVTTPQDVAILDSKKGLSMFKNAKIPVFGVVENMSYFEIPGTEERVYLFGQGGGQTLSTLLDVPYLGDVSINPHVREFADQGMPIVVAEPESIQALAFSDIAHKITNTICERGIEELMLQHATV